MPRQDGNLVENQTFVDIIIKTGFNIRNGFLNLDLVNEYFFLKLSASLFAHIVVAILV